MSTWNPFNWGSSAAAADFKDVAAVARKNVAAVNAASAAEQARQKAAADAETAARLKAEAAEKEALLKAEAAVHSKTEAEKEVRQRAEIAELFMKEAAKGVDFIKYCPRAVLHAKIAENLLAANYSIVDNADGEYSIITLPVVAVIAGVEPVAASQP